MSARTSAVLAFLLDAVFVVSFAAIGRATHDGAILGSGGSGLAQTAWPFLVALVIGWLVTLAWRAPARPVRTGLGVWAVTLVGGMLLRAVTGQGTAIPFIVVAAVMLLVTLVGWRLIAATVSALRKSRRDSTPTRG